MGSFQQVSIGAICLCAAFFFGNYVNNNPPLNQPPYGELAETAAKNEAVSNDVFNSGKVESRLSADTFQSVEQKPAPIITLKQPLRSQFGLPKVPNVTRNTQQQILPNRSDANNSTLPPPSQLAGGHFSRPTTNEGFEKHGNSPFINPPPIANQNTVNSTFAKPVVQIPDFSAIAADFNKTPARLPKTGMPIHGNQVEPPIQPNAQSSRTQPNPSLKDLAQQFRNQGNSRSDNFGGQDQPNRQINGYQPEVTFSPPSSFTSQDFEPDLNENIFGLKQHPTENSNWDDLSELAKREREPEQIDQTNHIRGNRSGAAKTDTGAQASMPENNSSIAPLSAEQRFKGQDIAKAQRPTYPEQANRSRLPFQLNEQAKTDLVRLRNRAQNKMGLESTRFVSHTVENGESLQSISTRYFGEPNYYLDIYLANRDKLRNPGHPPAGVTIRVPVYDAESP